MTHDQFMVLDIIIFFFAELFFIACILARISRSLDRLVTMAHFKVYVEDER